ncbi:hypothetical protein C4D60_Mb06t06970 [Musa balbisiana]|uniref:Uncharacterized protein n=1 Tax=Musa balbisiana TaxID=52838 RepID=A0A4S8IL60_MUSBA|nr:hypothetical protein C4D60_Mb06t06970 [Musa balbisiana]
MVSARPFGALNPGEDIAVIHSHEQVAEADVLEQAPIGEVIDDSEAPHRPFSFISIGASQGFDCQHIQAPIRGQSSTFCSKKLAMAA